MTFVVEINYFEFVVLTRNEKANLNRLSSIAGYLQQRTVLDNLFGVILIAKPTNASWPVFPHRTGDIFCAGACIPETIINASIPVIGNNSI